MSVPAFGKTGWLDAGFEGVREIVPPEVRVFDRLWRVHMRSAGALEPAGYERLAESSSQFC